MFSNHIVILSNCGSIKSKANDIMSLALQTLFIFINLFNLLYLILTGITLAVTTAIKERRRKTMVALWIIIGCLFLTGIGIRFLYQVLGISPVEATAVFILIALLVGVNSGPARQIIAQML